MSHRKAAVLIVREALEGLRTLRKELMSSPSLLRLIPGKMQEQKD
jgi:hypothetical protein